MLDHISFMSQFESLNDKEKKYLGKLFIQKDIKKNTYIVEQGSVSREVYFINNGMMAMIYHRNNNKFVRDFIFENGPAMVYPSFFNEELSAYSIKTITDCSIQVLTKENYELAKEKIPKMKSIAYRLTNLGHKTIEDRFRSLITLTAEERYLELLNKKPHLLLNIPLKLIASYLGITNVALSRIRKRISLLKNN